MPGRIRTLKPEWIEDSKMLKASPPARVLSIAMLLMADDHGRGVGDPEIIVPRIFPRHSREGLEGYQELLDLGFFITYEIRGQTYFAIVNWQKHQRIDRPGKPRVPPPTEVSFEQPSKPGYDNPRENSRESREFSSPDHDHDLDLDLDHDHELSTRVRALCATDPKPESKPKRKSKPKPAVKSEFDFEPVWALYPRKQSKQRGLLAAAKHVRTEADYAALLKAVEAMASAWEGHDTTYCPHFSTFVNQRRWEEDLPMPKGNGVKDVRVGRIEPSAVEDYHVGKLEYF
jgi:hypothetical protein